MNWLIVAIPLGGVALAILNLLPGRVTIELLGRAIVHFGLQPAIIFLAVSVMSLAAALLNGWRNLWRKPVVLLVTIAIITLVGLSASLLYRDDYFGGSCGEFDWPSGHLHAGYPYSWLDGGICVPPGNELGVYVRQHPGEAGWYPDPAALVVDLFFWADIGILVSMVIGTGYVIGRKKAEVFGAG